MVGNDERIIFDIGKIYELTVVVLHYYHAVKVFSAWSHRIITTVHVRNDFEMGLHSPTQLFVG